VGRIPKDERQEPPGSARALPDASRVRGSRIRGSRRGIRTGMLVAAGALVLVLVAGFVVRTVSVSEAQNAYDAAALAFRAQQSTAVDTVSTGESALDDAIALLDESAGKVLDEQPRLDLAAAVDTVTLRLSAAAQELTAAEVAADASTSRSALFEMGPGIRDDAKVLTAFDFTAASGVQGVAEDLAAPVAAVVQAMADWQAEQDRILRERYTNTVHATGWTPELDECIGSVDVTAHYENVPTIAEHWSCGGKDFPDDAGTVITLAGVHAGTYRVDGIVAMLNADRDSTADLPRGYDLLYQTCQNGYSGTMSFTALTRIS